MSMNAMFVQVQDAEIARFEADPDSVEALFANQTLPTTGLLNMTAAMQDRLRAIVTPDDGGDAFALARPAPTADPSEPGPHYRGDGIGPGR
jgi:hypothetical protein